MKKLIIILLLSYFCAAQNINTRIRTASLFHPLAIDLQWSAFTGGTTYTYTFDLPSVSTATCFWIQNKNPTNSRTFTYSIFVTPKYPGGAFGGGDSLPYAQIVQSTILPIPPLSPLAFPAPTMGGRVAQINLSLESGTAGGTPDTLDMWVSHAGSCPSGATGVSSGTPGAITVQGHNQWTATASGGNNVVLTASQTAISGVAHTL